MYPRGSLVLILALDGLSKLSADSPGFLSICAWLALNEPFRQLILYTGSVMFMGHTNSIPTSSIVSTWHGAWYSALSWITFWQWVILISVWLLCKIDNKESTSTPQRCWLLLIYQQTTRNNKNRKPLKTSHEPPSAQWQFELIVGRLFLATSRFSGSSP